MRGTSQGLAWTLVERKPWERKFSRFSLDINRKKALGEGILKVWLTHNKEIKPWEKEPNRWENWNTNVARFFIGINKRESVVVLKDSKKNKHIYISPHSISILFFKSYFFIVGGKDN